MPLAQQCQFLSLDLNNLQLPLPLLMLTLGIHHSAMRKPSSQLDGTGECVRNNSECVSDELPITVQKQLPDM